MRSAGLRWWRFRYEQHRRASSRPARRAVCAAAPAQDLRGGRGDARHPRAGRPRPRPCRSRGAGAGRGAGARTGQPAEVGDYLLGQQRDGGERLRTRTLLSNSAAANAGRRVSTELAGEAGDAARTCLRSDRAAARRPMRSGQLPSRTRRRHARPPTRLRKLPSRRPGAATQALPSSRRGGALLLAALVAAVVVVIVLVTSGGGGKKSHCQRRSTTSTNSAARKPKAASRCKHPARQSQQRHCRRSSPKAARKPSTSRPNTSRRHRQRLLRRVALQLAHQRAGRSARARRSAQATSWPGPRCCRTTPANYHEILLTRETKHAPHAARARSSCAGRSA